MCIAKVYLEKDGNKTLVMEEALLIEKQKDRFMVAGMFGNEKFIYGTIKSVDFIKSVVIFTEKKE